MKFDITEAKIIRGDINVIKKRLERMINSNPIKQLRKAYRILMQCDMHFKLRQIFELSLTNSETATSITPSKASPD